MQTKNKQTVSVQIIFSCIWGAVLALWLCLFPLYCGNSYTSITLSKYRLMLLLSCVTAAFFLFTIIFQICSGKKILHLPSKPVLVFALMYSLFMVLSCFFGPYHLSENRFGQNAALFGGYRYEGLISQMCYVGLFLIFSCVSANAKIATVSAGIGVLGFALVTTLQYLDLNPLGLFPEGKSVFTNYIFQGTIGNIDMVTAYLSLMIPVLFLRYVYHGKSQFELICGAIGLTFLLFTRVQCGVAAMIVFLIIVLFILLTMPFHRDKVLRMLACMCISAAVFLSVKFPWYDLVVYIKFAPSAAVLYVLAAVPVLLVISFTHLHWHRSFRESRAVLLILGVCASGVAAIAFLPIPKKLDGLYEMHQLLNGNASESFGTYRLGVWQQTLDMSKSNLLLGTGGDTFLFAFKDFLNAKSITFPETFDNPHNIFLSVLSNYGLPALICFIGMLVSSIVPAFKKWRTAIVFASGCLCFLAQGFFTFSLCIVSPMFYCCLGISASLIREDSKE